MQDSFLLLWLLEKIQVVFDEYLNWGKQITNTILYL